MVLGIIHHGTVYCTFNYAIEWQNARFTSSIFKLHDTKGDTVCICQLVFRRGSHVSMHNRLDSDIVQPTCLSSAPSRRNRK